MASSFSKPSLRHTSPAIWLDEFHRARRKNVLNDLFVPAREVPEGAGTQWRVAPKIKNFKLYFCFF
jgi:hypothetical protein